MQQISKENQQVFDYIGDLIVTEEFKSAQTEFFEKNYSHFDSEEENKHIYQNIYKEYANILDSSIESKLLEKFSETQINNFFETFANNYKSYSDQDTVETLFTFTDFDNFKKTMVDYNLRYTNKKNQENIDFKPTNKEFDIALYDKLYKTPLSDYKKIQVGKTENDPSFYSTKFHDTGLDIMRTDFVIDNCTVEAVSEKMVNMDFDEWKKYSKELLEAKYIKVVDAKTKYTYFAFKIPMMTPRDYVNINQHITRGDQHVISITPAELQDYPHTKDYIRGEYHQTAYVKQVSGKRAVKIVMFEVNDLKGYIPKMFMNMMLTKMSKDQISVFIQDCLAKQAQLDGEK